MVCSSEKAYLLGRNSSENRGKTTLSREINMSGEERLAQYSHSFNMSIAVWASWKCCWKKRNMFSDKFWIWEIFFLRDKCINVAMCLLSVPVLLIFFFPQNKTCVQTLEGHAQNVSCVSFHPELPIIITGSEDGNFVFSDI